MSTETDTSKVSFSGAVMASGIGFIILLLLAEVLLRFVYPQWSEFASNRFLAIENIPGYGPVVIGRAGFDGHFSQNNGDFRVSIQVNEFGLRNPEPVETANKRVWIVGDSMTFGWGVERDEMYSSRIAKYSGIATYNVGAPGADICGYQALVARMPKELMPKAVVVGLIIENDIKEYDCRAAAKASKGKEFNTGYKFDPLNLSSWKRQLTISSALYNFFAVSVKSVGGFEALFRSLGLINPHQHKAHSTSDANIENAAESVAFELNRLRSQFLPATPFSVLVVPSRFEIRDDDSYWSRLRKAVINKISEEKIDVLDPTDAFKNGGLKATHFSHDGHWSTLGHTLAAETVVPWLVDAIATGK